MIDGQFFDKRDIPNEYLTALDSKLFIKFCASEFSLEVYLSIMSVMAYRKESSMDRLVAFSEAFLGDDSPLQINTTGGQANFVKNCLIVGSDSSEVVEKRLKTALDLVLKDVKTAFADTFGRYNNKVNSKSSKFDFFHFKLANKTHKFAYRYKNDYKKYVKKLSDVMSSDTQVKAGLDILADGGYPIRKMGLSGIVAGL